MPRNQLKSKKCKQCGNEFKPYRTLQILCSPECAILSVKTKTAKSKIRSSKRLDDAKARDSIKTRSEWLEVAGIAFNSFIRARDKGKPCISCKIRRSQLWDAGHYRGKKSHPEFRFDESNVHKQCRACNCFLSGNLIEYRKNLIERIGVAGVERLEGHIDHEPLSIDDIKAIRAKYKLKLKGLR